MKKIKARSTDFQYSDLPRNRTLVFFDVLKNQWRKLAFCALLLLVGFLPYLIVIFCRDYYLIGVQYALNQGKISQTDGYKLFCISHLIGAGASWLCFYFLVFPLGGVFRIIRQLIWGEPVFLKEDFVTGAKQNYKFGAIIATFFGLMVVLSRLMLFINDNTIIQSIPMAIFLALIVPPLFITYAEGAIYNGKFGKLFHNAVLMFIKRAPHALLFTFILISPIFLKYIESFIVLKYILLIVVIFFFLVLLLMIYSLFSNYLFDLFINTTNYPDQVRKGMSKNN